MSEGNKGSLILALGWCGMGLSGIAVALRFYSRLCVKRTAGLDDLFIFICFVSMRGVSASIKVLRERS